MSTPSREGWIPWIHSRTREILLQDLNDGVLPLDEKEISAETAWNIHYQHMVEVKLDRVVFSQFKDRLRDHRKQVRKKKGHLNAQLAALKLSREVNPPKTHNRRGEIIFAFTEAAKLLKKDIAEGKMNNLTHNELYSSRQEYQDSRWDFTFFKRQVDQYSATQRFYNWMDHKRQEKEARKKKKKDKARGEDIEEEEQEEEEDDEFHYTAFFT